MGKRTGAANPDLISQKQAVEFDVASKIDGPIGRLTQLQRSLLFAEISMLSYLRDSEAQPVFREVTVEPSIGFIPPHTGVDLESIADADQRTMAKLAHDSLVVDQFRFDASDMMPRAIGTELLWGAMVEWFDQGPDELERIVAEVEDAWVALESGQDGS